MKGHWVKIIVGFIIIGAYAIIITSGVKYGWHEGVLWYLIGFTVLLLAVYFINKLITRNK